MLIVHYAVFLTCISLCYRSFYPLYTSLRLCPLGRSIHPLTGVSPQEIQVDAVGFPNAKQLMVQMINAKDVLFSNELREVNLGNVKTVKPNSGMVYDCTFGIG